MTVTLLRAVVALPVVLYMPGWVWNRLFARPADALDRHFDRAIVSALWSGWLALLLAELGIFTLPLHLGLTLTVCAIGWLATRRFGLGMIVPALARPRWELPVYAGVLIIFGLIVARPFETMLGGRDAGVYANIGYLIAHTGSIVQHEPLIAEIAHDRLSDDPAVREPAAQAYTNLLGKQAEGRFTATRFTQPSFFSTEEDVLQGRIVPGFLHLYPAWLGLWTAILGLHGGLAATGYLGWLGLWSVAMTGRRLLRGAMGVYTGALALAFVGFNTLQIWFSRYTTAEIGTQMLLWAGLALWAQYASLPDAERQRRAGRWYALLTGIAIGQLLLMRIEFYWGVGPLALYLLAALLRRRWGKGETALALGMGAMLLHGIIHIRTIAWAYFLDNTWGKFQDFAIISRLVHSWYNPTLQAYRINNAKGHAIYESTPRFLAELGLLALMLIGLWAVWHWPAIWRRVEQTIVRWRRPLLIVAGFGIVLAAIFAYFIRPQRLTLDAVLHPLPNRALWESYIGAPLPVPVAPSGQQQRAVVLGNMVRLGWYLSPLGIGLGVAGVVGWLWRDLNRRSWLVLLIGIAYTAFPIIDTYGTADQAYIYIARRFVPGAVPMLGLGAAWLVAWLLLRQRIWWRWIGGASAALLLLFLVGTGWRAARHVEYVGAIDGVQQLAQRIEPAAIVLMRGGDRDTPTNIATPLRYGFDREVLVAYSIDPLPYRRQLAEQVRRWLATGRPVYLLLGSNGGTLYLPGLQLIDRGAFDLRLREWQQLQLQKPFTAGEIGFSYRLYELQPAADDAPAFGPLAVDDYRWQAGGFYAIEHDRTTAAPYAWTNGAAQLLLPATDGPTTLDLRLALGTLPPSLVGQPVEVCPTLTALTARAITTTVPLQLPCQSISSTTPLTLTWNLPALDAATQNQQFIAPTILPPPDGWLLTLGSRIWTPNEYAAEYPTPPNDGRSLGVQWYGGVWRPDN